MSPVLSFHRFLVPYSILRRKHTRRYRFHYELSAELTHTPSLKTKERTETAGKVINDNEDDDMTLAVCLASNIQKYYFFGDGGRDDYDYGSNYY